MAGKARLSLVRNQFVAHLDDGRYFECGDIREMACLLFLAGVGASEVEFEWHAGQRLLTAGQQVALLAELRLCATEQPEPEMAASAGLGGAAA